MDASALSEISVYFDNTSSQKTELIAVIDSILDSRKLSRQDAFRPHGRLQCTSGQVFGRVVKSALAITQHAYGSTGEDISPEIVLSLSLHKYFLVSGP